MPKQQNVTLWIFTKSSTIQSRDCPFEMAKVVALVHPNATLQVPVELLVNKRDLFANEPSLAAFPYHLKSRVSASNFQKFVSALEGTTVKVTKNNFKGLLRLCEEFRFRDFSTQLSQFGESGDLKAETVPISVLEDRMRQHDHEIVALQAELSRQLRVQESLEQSIRTEVESATLRANDVEKRVAEVESEVENLRKALREVRERAEGAQTKAASTEAQFEAGVLALRTALVVPAVVPMASAPASAAPPPPLGWNSEIVPDFPTLFEDFKQKHITLLWRGSCDGFHCWDFHGRCDGRPNTLTVILDTHGYIFGGFTPVEWESSKEHWFRFDEPFFKADPSLKSFLFTLKNPHNFPARRFALKAEGKDEAIECDSYCGPCFRDIWVSDDCNAENTNCTEYFGTMYDNDTGLNGKTFFTGSQKFKVKEIEVFEIRN
jgi:hypothetical protein